MCGICGIVRFDGEPIDPDRVRRAVGRLRHRGPDHAGVWSDSRGATGLGAARLSVIDPSPHAHQPMTDPTGRFAVVFNGAIYNFRDLRTELEALGRTFHTLGDTEVVLQACAEWGTSALRRLDGMWALAFFDSQRSEGFAARDPAGIKPLYYSRDARRLLFASELAALSCLDARGIDERIDSESVVSLLSLGYILGPGTIHASIRNLPPGHAMTWSQSGAMEPRPFVTEAAAPSTPDDYSVACAELRSRVGNAVCAQRVSDVPLGAFLSGGLDSSIVVKHLAEASGRTIDTFCVGYENVRAYDERAHARLVASRFGTRHHDVVLTERDVLAALPAVLDHLDEPFGDSSILPTALVSQFARRQVTVAMSGDGGDELFGGYWRYLGHAAMNAYRRLPRSFRFLIVEPLLGRMGVSRGGALRGRLRQVKKLLRADSDDPLSRHLAWSRILPPSSEDLFRSSSPGVPTATTRLRERLRRRAEELAHQGDDWLAGILRFDMAVPLVDDMLRKVDRASMMHSLEVRVPLLDRRVVEFAMALPTRWKVSRGLRKRILVDAYRGHLPHEILDRPKQGFEVPIGEYLRGPLRGVFHDAVTPSTLTAIHGAGGPDIDAAVVARLVQEHASRTGDHADVLFALLSLCWWWRRRATP